MRPKFGIKNYEIYDRLKEPAYKMDKNQLKKDKPKKPDGVFDQYIKMKAFVPAAKYDMICDWTKNFDKRGVLPKG